jgi:hypothetical protein
MWDWINCHLAGRHEYVVWTETDRMFLRCLRCERRSRGWQVASIESGGRRAPHTEQGKAARHGLIAGARSLFGQSRA